MNIQDTLKNFITQNLLNNGHSPALNEDDNLLTSGLIDSLEVMRLINFIEERFDLHVPPEDVTIENFRTLKVIAGYIQRRIDSLQSAER